MGSSKRSNPKTKYTKSSQGYYSMMQKVDDKLVCKVYYAIGATVDTNHPVYNIKVNIECIDIIWDEVRKGILDEIRGP